MHRRAASAESLVNVAGFELSKYLLFLSINFDPLAQFRAQNKLRVAWHIVGQLFWLHLLLLFFFLFFFSTQAARPKTAWAQVSLSSRSFPFLSQHSRCFIFLFFSSSTGAKQQSHFSRTGNNVLINAGNGRGRAFNLPAEPTEMISRLCILCIPCVCVCVRAVAEKTTGAMGNIVAATGLVKKDEFPADMNVRTSTSNLSPVFLFANIPPSPRTFLVAQSENTEPRHILVLKNTHMHFLFSTKPVSELWHQSVLSDKQFPWRWACLSRLTNIGLQILLCLDCGHSSH